MIPRFAVFSIFCGRSFERVTAVIAGTCFLVLFSTRAFGQDGLIVEKILIAVDGGYPPHSMVLADGTVGGLDIELAKEICVAANLHCELTRPPWDDMIPMLERGEIDAIVATLSPTEERKKRVDFTSVYVNAKVGFIGKERQGKGDLNAFKRARIGVEGSTSLDGYLSETFPEAKITRVRSVKALFGLLINNEVDYVFTSALVGSYYFLATPLGDGYSLVGPEIKSDKWFGKGAAIAVNKKSGALKAKLNRAIEQIRGNGTYQKIIDKYL